MLLHWLAALVRMSTHYEVAVQKSQPYGYFVMGGQTYAGQLPMICRITCLFGLLLLEGLLMHVPYLKGYQTQQL